jgi:hypothetical protein
MKKDPLTLQLAPQPPYPEFKPLDPKKKKWRKLLNHMSSGTLRKMRLMFNNAGDHNVTSEKK